MPGQLAGTLRGNFTIVSRYSFRTQDLTNFESAGPTASNSTNLNVFDNPTDLPDSSSAIITQVFLSQNSGAGVNGINMSLAIVGIDISQIEYEFGVVPLTIGSMVYAQQPFMINQNTTVDFPSIGALLIGSSVDNTLAQNMDGQNVSPGGGATRSIIPVTTPLNNLTPYQVYLSKQVGYLLVCTSHDLTTLDFTISITTYAIAI